jgi:DNA-binding beta-propeller fold protein YncE
LAFDPFAHRAFVTCINKLMTVVNTDTGAVVAALPIGLGSDAAAFDPSRKRAFSSNADGTLSIIQEVDPNTFVSLGSIKTALGGRTMSIDHKTGRLFIAAADMAPAGPPGPDGKPARPKPVPGSLKLLFLDPVD